MSNSIHKELLNKTEAAELLGVTRKTIHEWSRTGFGPRFVQTPGGREYTTLTSCQNFIAQLSGQADGSHVDAQSQAA